MMKRILLLLMLPAFFLTAQAQDDGDMAYRVSFTGAAPTICDFVDALLSHAEDEALGTFDGYWQLYKKGNGLPPAVKIKVDKPNGFVSYSHLYAEDNSKQTIETCYWNCKDGRHKIVGQVIATYQNGRPVMGQYDGITFYTYDSKTRILEWTPTGDVCGDEFNEIGLTDGTVINLPDKGKDISLWLNTSNGMKHYTLKWNGGGFDFIKK